jgi:hypothetical protein
MQEQLAGAAMRQLNMFLDSEAVWTPVSPLQVACQRIQANPLLDVQPSASWMVQLQLQPPATGADPPQPAGSSTRRVVPDYILEALIPGCPREYVAVCEASL